MTQNDAVCLMTVVNELPAPTARKIKESEAWKDFERRYRAGLATMENDAQEADDNA